MRSLDDLFTKLQEGRSKPMNIPGYNYGVLTFTEVAEIMTARGHKMTKSRVQQIEKRALQKMQKDKVLKSLLEEIL